LGGAVAGVAKGLGGLFKGRGRERRAEKAEKREVKQKLPGQKFPSRLPDLNISGTGISGDIDQNQFVLGPRQQRKDEKERANRNMVLIIVGISVLVIGLLVAVLKK